MAFSSSRATSSLPRHLFRNSRRPRCEVAATAVAVTAPALVVSSRSLSTSFSRGNVEDPRPRWSYTPEAMLAKVRLNPIRNPSRTVWETNEDPDLLDEMYKRFLGPGGDRLLPSETKWLAVTHKSFDQGRRGFNDRLAYFGRTITVLEAAQFILALDPKEPPPDKHKREHFRHPVLDRTTNFHKIQPAELMAKGRIARLAAEVGITKVMRWKPRLPENLLGSGIDIVLNQTVFAIIGAIALTRGSATASKMARNQIFKKIDGMM